MPLSARNNYAPAANLENTTKISTVICAVFLHISRKIPLSVSHRARAKAMRQKEDHIKKTNYLCEHIEAELMEIVELSTKANKRLLTDSSTHQVQQILREAMTQPNFGNMRFARSLVEKAMLRQAGRVMALPAEQVTDEDIHYLTADDFGDVPQSTECHCTIGFVG